MLGFFRGAEKSTQATGGALVTFFSEDLEATQQKLKQPEAASSNPLFPFPADAASIS
ncbi:hypothetical protein P4E94_06255 [Pontiellaceae bacterium B12219]|nr:hypothetical protein [Pontiellaceae bacterium B12219]